METGFCVFCQKAAIGGLTHPRCKTTHGIDGVFASLVYKGVVKKLIYQFKYRPYLTILQGLLTEFFYEGLIQKEVFYKLLQKEAVFVPIPLHKYKMRKRGYNQSYLLAKGLGQKFSLPILDCLERTRNTTTQVGLSQKERAENIEGAFAIKTTEISNLKGYTHIFLIDDVVTSGATIKEAAKMLKRSGVENVWGIILAHGQ